jgi:hypothetical protein
MNLSALDYALWVAGFLGSATLFSILIYRRRWREFPVFTTLNGYEAAMGVVLYSVFRLCPYVWYVRIFWWSYVLFDQILLLGVIWEIARTVMRPTGIWIRDARKQFLLWGAAGILLAAALPWLVTPPYSKPIEILLFRVGLFNIFVICELYCVMLRTSRSLGLGWSNHVMALGTGWTAWAMVAFLVEVLHSYFGLHQYFRELEHVRMFTSLGVDVYWAVQFWREEPARQPISPQLRAYILDLHKRINNDLDTLGAQR